MKKLTSILLILAILIVPTYAMSAECAVLYDTLTGEILYEKDAHKRHLIASTTKIMTALVVIENCDMDEQVVIRPEHVRVEGSSMYLRVGETVTVRELLYGLLLMSGNDAGLTLAYHCGGDVESFVKMMNECADDLGLENTSFENPHGLDGDAHYSTAFELAILADHAMKNEVFREIVGSKNYNSGTRSMQNHNKLLWRFDGAVGVKTGFTKAAGRCLVSAAERDGRMLIAVTLNAPDDWNDHINMYNEAYKKMSLRAVTEKGKIVGKIPVIGGRMREVEVYTGENINFALTDEDVDKIKYELYTGQFEYAPVTAGECAGKVRIYCAERLIGETEILYAQTVEQRDAENVFLKIWNEILAKIDSI